MSQSSGADSEAWKVHDAGQFARILGAEPRLDLLMTVDHYPFAHEACVYLPTADELFVTSNQFKNAAGERTVRISKVKFERSENGDIKGTKHEEIECDVIAMGNGGVNNFPDVEGSIIFCDQGSATPPSGLFTMDAKPETGYKTEPLVTSFNGRPFNSVNDVVVSIKDNSVWFTDPAYGAAQGYRPAPELPAQVYEYKPASPEGPASIRAVADGFVRPNGLCFSPDEDVMYVTDTGAVRGDGVMDLQGPASIYAFDVISRHGERFLANRRLFAYADNGIPDGIKCDLDGNVYSGCGDGVHVWSPGGKLLGKILVGGAGVANFCFGRPGEIFLLNEERLYRATVDKSVRGALLASYGHFGQGS